MAGFGALGGGAVGAMADDDHPMRGMAVGALGGAAVGAGAGYWATRAKEGVKGAAKASIPGASTPATGNLSNAVAPSATAVSPSVSPAYIHQSFNLQSAPLDSSEAAFMRAMESPETHYPIGIAKQRAMEQRQKLADIAHNLPLAGGHERSVVIHPRGSGRVFPGGASLRSRIRPRASKTGRGGNRHH